MRSARRLVALILFACAAPATAAAQATSTAVDLHQYQPTPFSDRVLRLDGPAVLPFGQFRVGADLDYGFRPLVLADAAPAIVPGSGGPYALVRHAAGATLTASFGLSHRLEAALAVPLMLFQSGDDVAGVTKPGLVGVGNVRIGLKANLLSWRGLGAGAAVLVAVPGGVGAFTHESGLGGEARLFAGYARGRFSAGVRAGFRLRAEQNLFDIALGNELTGAAGVTFALFRRTAVLGEIAGVTAVSNPFADQKRSPLELLVGARQRIGKTWLTLAGGPGLVEGYGSPLFRVVAGLTWANVPPDSDGDGVPDDDDACPEVPEDRDGFQDSDGCPDPDNDKDGIPDTSDRCPESPEDKDGFQDTDGCPDPDNDKDGIPDTSDKCPDKPETVNDFEDEDGCPDETPPPSDKDKDGILDDVDECPEEAEDKDGFEDDDGCPDPDNDKDGILDARDKCPLEPETINGIEDDDGCPDKGQTQVRLGPHEIETLQPIYFDTDRSRVRHAFYNIMGQIALLLKAHPEIGRCAVEGHTDDTGPPEWNQKLSVLRAESVIEFLVNRGGVDPNRLVPIGHGEKTPWTSNDTPWGRAKNRRVVFHIEGVNAEEQHKQELRQERRRIRKEREREQRELRESKQRQETESQVQPKPETKSDKADKSARPDKPDRKDGATGGTPSEKRETKPAETKPAETKPAETKPAKAGAGDGKAEKSDLKTTEAGNPSKPAEPSSRPAPTGKPSPAPAPLPRSALPKGGPAAPESVTEEEEAEPEASPAAKGTRPRAERPPRPAKRPPDAGAGPPPTLRDLLKLPPR